MAKPQRHSPSLLKRLLLPLVPVSILLALWLSILLVSAPPPAVVPRPLDVLRVPFGQPDYWRFVTASAVRLVWGFLLAIITAVPIGLAVGMSRRWSQTLSPIVTALSAISGIAWIPLALAWFGPGNAMALFVIWNASFFLIFTNTMSGVQLVSRSLQEGLSVLGASPRRILTDVLIPGAAPYILVGMRSGLSFGWRAVITAELVGAAFGLGQWISTAQEFARTDIIMAGAITIGLVGLLMDRMFLAPIERWTVNRWGTAGVGR